MSLLTIYTKLDENHKEVVLCFSHAVRVAWRGGLIETHTREEGEFLQSTCYECAQEARR